MNKHPIRRIDLFWLLVVAAALLFPALDATPFRRAEIYFADVARAMVERADWLVPYYRGAPFFDKPVLSYWLMTSSFQLFGFSGGAARLAPALAALCVILSTVWLGWLLWEDHRSALFGGWILVATAPFMTFGRMAMSDMLLTLWCTLAMALAIACYRTQRPSVPIVALGAVLGLGFLTKGPIALLVPALGSAYLVWSRRKQHVQLPLPALIVAAVVFTIVSFGWFVAIYARLGWQPLEHFFVRENLQRFMADTHDARRPVWFYAVTYLGVGAPWSLLLPLAAVRFFRREPDPGSKLLLIWMLLVGVFLSASRGKVDYYLLPLYPAAALVVARYLCVAAWGRIERVCATAIFVLVGLLLILLPILLVRVPVEWRPQGIVLGGASLALVLAGIVCFRIAVHPRPSTVLPPMVFTVSVVFAVANIFVLPSFYSAQPNSSLVEDVSRERLKRPELAFALHEDPTQVHRDLLFHARLAVETVDSDRLEQLASSSKPYLLLTGTDEAESLKALPGVRQVGEYSYLSSKVFTLRGVFFPTRPDRIVLLANFGG